MSFPPVLLILIYYTILLALSQCGNDKNSGLKELLAMGSITPEEFDTKKKELLNL